jgi:hypothetical protein
MTELSYDPMYFHFFCTSATFETAEHRASTHTSDRRLLNRSDRSSVKRSKLVVRNKLVVIFHYLKRVHYFRRCEGSSSRHTMPYSALGESIQDEMMDAS